MKGKNVEILMKTMSLSIVEVGQTIYLIDILTQCVYKLAAHWSGAWNTDHWKAEIKHGGRQA